MYQQIADAYTAEHPRGHVRGDLHRRLVGCGRGGPRRYRDRHRRARRLPARRRPPARRRGGRCVQPVNELLEARDIPFGDGIQRTGLTAFSANAQLACMPSRRLAARGVLQPQAGQTARARDRGREPPPPLYKGWRWETFLAAAEQAVERGGRSAPRAATSRPTSRRSRRSSSRREAAWSTTTSSPSQLTLGRRRHAGRAQDTRRRSRATRRSSLTPAEVAQESALDRFKDGRLGVLFGTRGDGACAARGARISTSTSPRCRGVDSTETTR